MRYEYIIGDYVQSKASGRIGRVTEINEYYEYIIVDYPTDRKRRYGIHDRNHINEALRRLTLEERADILLARENSGITDYWRD